MTRIFLKFESQSTPEHTFMERNYVDLSIWHEFFHYVGSHCRQRAEWMSWWLSWGVNPSCTCTYYAIYANYAKKCNLHQTCQGTHVGDGVGDCSWCCHVDDVSRWAQPLIDVVLLVQYANTSLVEREMWSTYIQTMHNMHNVQTIQTIQNMQNMSMYIPIDWGIRPLVLTFGCIFCSSRTSDFSCL